MIQLISRRAALANFAGGFALAGCATSMKAKGMVGALTNDPVAMMIQPEGVFDLYVSGIRPLVMLSSGTSLPVPVLFDTGSNGNMIDRSVFEHFGLKKKPNHKSFITDAAGTTVETFAAEMPDARLSALPVVGASADVLDYRDGDELGILGPELFRGCSVYMNFPKRAVYVRNALATPVNVRDAQPYAPADGNGLPTMNISIQGQSGEIPALIDTGKNAAVQFPESMIDTLPLIARPEIVGEATTVFETVPVYGATIDGNVQVGTETLIRPKVIFHGDMPKVGMEALRSQRIWLEPHNQRAWVAREQTLYSGQAIEFAGRFGIRTIAHGPAGLIYQRGNEPKRALIYLGGDHFLFEDSKDDLIFRRDTNGAVSGYTILGQDSRPIEYAR